MSKEMAKVKEKPAANSTAAQATNCLENDSVKSYLNGLKPKDIPVDDIFGFRNHPYSVNDNELDDLIASIRDHGIITPVIVKPMGEKYEMISGHRRLRAAELLGFRTVPAYVKEFSDTEAVIIMAQSNIQREKVLPSEKAKAFKMQYEVMKHQGKPGGGSSLDQIAEANGISSKQVQNYLLLNKLVPELLARLDAGKIKFTTALELAKLPEEEQRAHLNGTTKTVAPVANLTLRDSEIREFFPDSYSRKERKETILRLLREWKHSEETTDDDNTSETISETTSEKSEERRL